MKYFWKYLSIHNSENHDQIRKTGKKVISNFNKQCNWICYYRNAEKESKKTSTKDSKKESKPAKTPAGDQTIKSANSEGNLSTTSQNEDKKSVKFSLDKKGKKDKSKIDVQDGKVDEDKESNDGEKEDGTSKKGKKESKSKDKKGSDEIDKGSESKEVGKDVRK